MRKLFLPIILGLSTLSVTACKHPKGEKGSTQISKVSSDTIEKDTFVDDEFEDRMEVIINVTKNTAIIRLEGKTYELKRSHDLPDYTAEDAEYRYSDIKGEITFLKRDYDMVLFHHKSKSEEKKAAKMASY